MNYLLDESSASDSGSTPSTTSEIAQQLRALWHGVLRECERTAHLDRQQFWVLCATAPGTIRMSQLAQHTQTSQASLTGIIDRMEDRGLVTRERSSEDRRVVEVSLTQLGREELSRTQKVFTERLEATFAPLSPEERASFLGTLRRLNEPATQKCDCG